MLFFHIHKEAVKRGGTGYGGIVIKGIIPVLVFYSGNEMRSDPLFRPPIIMNYDGIAGLQLLAVP